MAEQLMHDPDQYKDIAAGVIRRGDSEELGNAQNLFHSIQEGQAAQAAETGKATREDASIAYDVAYAVKPDIRVIGDSEARIKKRLKAKADGVFETDSARAINRRKIGEQNLLKKGAEIDLEQNATKALHAAQVLGQLATRR